MDQVANITEYISKFRGKNNHKAYIEKGKNMHEVHGKINFKKWLKVCSF